MSLTLEGRLLQVVRSERIDRTTGEVQNRVTVEILHISKGRSALAQLAVDLTVAPAWEKIAGSGDKLGELVRVEVAPYAMSGRDGEIIAGLTCADKKAAPVVISRALKVA